MSTSIRRFQRYKQTESHRALFAEHHVRKDQLVMPMFIHEGLREKKEIPSLPGIFQHSLTSAIQEAREIYKSGVKSVLLFGIPTTKDPLGSEAYNPDGVVQKTIRAIKKEVPELVIMADCCLCEYTDHGHCGVQNNGCLNNDETLSLLAKTALTYAQSGADFIAPSGMMDGHIRAIRSLLDDQKFGQVGIISYAIKYASVLYGPFRDAAGSADNFLGNRKHHQLNPSQSREGLEKALTDIGDGADAIIVKPAGWYSDMIQKLRAQTNLPIVAYQVSGEYAMIKVAAQQGILSEKEAFSESLLGLKRAGADLIITYYAKEWAWI